MRALVTREEPIKSALDILRTNMGVERKDRLVEDLIYIGKNLTFL